MLPTTTVTQIVGQIILLKDDVIDIPRAIQTVATRFTLPVHHRFMGTLAKGFSTHLIPSANIRETILKHPFVKEIQDNHQTELCSIDLSWHMERIGLGENATVNIGSGNQEPGIHVFVLDSGINLQMNTHINVVESESMLRRESVEDMIGHGTAVACVIGAKDNTSDIVGVCPNVLVHAYKVVARDGKGSFGELIVALEKVAKYKQVNQDTDVVVYIGTSTFVGTTVHNILDVVVSELVTVHKVHVVVPAGNQKCRASLCSPGHVEDVITVGSYNEKNELSEFSNFGRSVNMLAPGENIHVLMDKTNIGLVSGTSFAAAHVVGAVCIHLMSNALSDPYIVKEYVLSYSLDAAPQSNASVDSSWPNTTQLSVYVADI
jgi:subtilisin family serine protease